MRWCHIILWTGKTENLHPINSLGLSANTDIEKSNTEQMKPPERSGGEAALPSEHSTQSCFHTVLTKPSKSRWQKPKPFQITGKRRKGKGSGVRGSFPEAGTVGETRAAVLGKTMDSFKVLVLHGSTKPLGVMSSLTSQRLNVCHRSGSRQNSWSLGIRSRVWAFLLKNVLDDFFPQLWSPELHPWHHLH